MSNLGSLPCGKALNGLLESSVGKIWLAWSSLEKKTRGTAYLVLCEGSVTDKMSVFSDLITTCCFQSHFFLWES